MRQEDYERAVIIQTRIDQCNYILDMIEKNKAIRIAQGDRSMTIQDPGLVKRIIKDIKEHRENLRFGFELFGRVCGDCKSEDPGSAGRPANF